MNVVSLKVANCDLHGLGINLGLDQIKVQDIVTVPDYHLDDPRQRLMELWFTSHGFGDESPTWEKLREALPSCEHSGGSGGSTGTCTCTRNTERYITVFSPAYLRYVGPTSIQFRIPFDVGIVLIHKL